MADPAGNTANSGKYTINVNFNPDTFYHLL